MLMGRLNINADTKLYTKIHVTMWKKEYFLNFMTSPKEAYKKERLIRWRSQSC